MFLEGFPLFLPDTTQCPAPVACSHYTRTSWVVYAAGSGHLGKMKTSLRIKIWKIKAPSNFSEMVNTHFHDCMAGYNFMAVNHCTIHERNKISKFERNYCFSNNMSNFYNEWIRKNWTLFGLMSCFRTFHCFETNSYFEHITRFAHPYSQHPI